MSKRKEIIRQAGIYTFSAQLTQLITLVAAVLSRRFLGPTQMGIWATLQIVVEYSKYSSMGIMYGMAREIPYLHGKGAGKTAEEIKDITFTVVLSGSFLIALGILIFAFLMQHHFSAEITNGLYLISAIVILQRLNDLMIGLLRSHKEFTLASSQMIWSAVINAFLVAFFTYFFKIYGFIWAMILSFIFNILYIHVHHNFHFRLQFEPKKFKSLVAFGIPLMLIGVMTSVLRSIDKITVAKLLGFEALGFYSIAFMVTSYLGGFFNSIAIVLFPHLQERFSFQDDPRDLKEPLHQVAYGYALLMPVLIGGVWVVAPSLIALFLPKFTPGIEAVKALSLSVFFLALAQPFNDFLITIKKHFLLFPLLGVTSLFALGFNYMAIRTGFGITGVASATSLTAFFNFSILYFFACRYLVHRIEALKKYVILLGLAAYTGFVLWLINSLIYGDPYSFQQMGAQLVLFAIFYSPLVFLLNQKFRLIGLLRERFFVKPVESDLKVGDLY